MIQENGQQGKAAGTVLAFLLSIEEAGVSSLLTELWGFPYMKKYTADIVGCGGIFLERKDCGEKNVYKTLLPSSIIYSKFCGA